MIETILIAVEDNQERMEPVVEHAAEIASSIPAHVVLYHVYEPEQFKSLLSARNLESADPVEMARQNETVEAAAATLREADVEFTIEASTGNADEELLSYIKGADVDHIFVGGRKRSPAGKALLGSVSQQILLKSDVPCTLVR
jgi:nucleotide-binding universal stress UspA family protein